MNKIIVAVAGAAILAGACTSTGNIERNAAGGAALGALAGAVIGNNVGDGNAGRGAAIGAVLGGAAGAIRGSQQDRQQRNLSRQWDARAGQYYYCYPEGDCYWENGQRRY
jgi:membrane associated rhomboid family serine protease